MVKKLLIIACLLSLFGCRQAFKKNEMVEDDSIKQIKIDNIDEDFVLKFSDVFERINFIRLETLDNCLIGHIDKIIATDDKFIILDSSSARMVFVFNNDGTFSNRIGTNGGGPEEYDEPSDIAYDKYDDELLVLCHNRKMILRFKLDGTFAGKTKIDWWVKSICVVDKNACLLYFNNRIQSNGKKNDYNIFIINKEGKIIEKLLPFDKETGELSPPKPSFSYYDNEILYAPYAFNHIYQLNDNKMKVKYFVDFGKRKIPESTFKNKTDVELDIIIRDNDHAFNRSLLETSSHVICQFVYKGRGYDCYWSKETETAKISSVYFNDMYALLTGGSVDFYLKGDSLINFIEPLFVNSYKDMIETMKKNKKDMNDVLLSNISLLPDGKMKDNFIKILNTKKITLTDVEIDFINSIEEEDNPILMVAKLKQF